MSTEPALDRQAARVRAFRLVQEIQGAGHAAAAELGALASAAAGAGWDEVVRVGLFGRAVDLWFRRDPGVGEAVSRLVESATAAEDNVMLAVALAMRSDVAFAGPEDAPAAEADLARAVVLLEQASDSPLECITGHTACGIALAARWLFELADEQYAAALDVGSAQPPGAADFLLAPVMFNRAELHLAWASLLRQLGDATGVGERWRTWRAAGMAAASFGMPEVWQAELRAHGLLLAAIAGEDVAIEAAERLEQLERLEGRGQDASRASSHLLLAWALSDAQAGRAEAAERAEVAARRLDPDASPHVYDLALHLAAELEAADGRRAGIRYGHRQLEQHWSSRLASLGAMRARIQAERLAAEREILSRHARTDDLTGVGNRRALDQYMADVRRLDVGTVALILIDVNAFKEVNDRHGHLAGDAVLMRIGLVLGRSVRPSDLAVRLGGDEFAVVLAHADLEAAVARAIDIAGQIDRASFDDISPGLTVALSAGVAAGAPARLTELRALADAALYRAKAGEGEKVVRSRVARAERA